MRITTLSKGLIFAFLAAGCSSKTPAAPPPVVGTVRFVAVGDTGTGTASQKAVAKAIADKCQKDGCDFVQLLGDNFYETGVTSADDEQFKTKFEEPYAAISAPFYVALGNHDYGGNGLGTEHHKGQFEIDYAKKNSKFKIPDAYFTRSHAHVDFFTLDSNMQMFDKFTEQKAAVSGWIKASKSHWKIAVAHHPYLSNGSHGNAGNYDNLEGIAVYDGARVKSFDDDVICGQVDVLITGHDHNRQWLKETCKGTELIVSGAGAKTSALVGKNATHFQKDTLGFVYILIDGRNFTAEFIDENGKVEFSRTITK